MRDWTVLVYMAADRQHDEAMEAAALLDRGELRNVGSSARVGVGVHLDLELYRPVEFSLDEKGRVLDLTHPRALITGKPETLKSFLAWGMKTLPARHYLLVVWGHGSGVGIKLRSLSLADVAYGGPLHRRDGLNPRELNGVFTWFEHENGSRLDLLGFDSCLMAGVELAFELRASVRWIVGSQVLFPQAGWPYDRILRHLRAHPAITPRALGHVIVQETLRSYRSSPKTDYLTQTLLDLRASDGVVEAVKVLCAALTSAIAHPRELEAVRRALYTAQWLDVREYLDLADLCRRFQEECRDTHVRLAAAKVLARLARDPKHLVAEHRRRGEDTKGSNGLTIYCRAVPKRGTHGIKRDAYSAVTKSGRRGLNQRKTRRNQLDDSTYRKLRFPADKHTGWAHFVDEFDRRLKALRAQRLRRRRSLHQADHRGSQTTVRVM